MKKSLFILFAILVSSNISVFAQSTSEANANQVVEKASYKGNLDRALWEKLNYPPEAYTNQVTGDVILSFKINTNGNIEDINVISTPAEILSTSSIASLEGLSQVWNPCKVNGVPIDKTYLLVYRYRVLTNRGQVTLESKADKLMKKKKFDKALKIYDQLLEDNKFDYNLFEKRANLNELMGNLETANEDIKQAELLKNGVMTSVDVFVIKNAHTKPIGTVIQKVSEF